jgi:Txe/YoeB family toxin of Txe-Axe toxin-antitoxin module
LQEEENEEEEATYTLRPEAKKKYPLSQEQKLITALTNLIASIENTPYYSSSNLYSALDEQNEDYYSLPHLTEQGQVKT